MKHRRNDTDGEMYCDKSEMGIFAKAPTQMCVGSSQIVSYSPISSITHDNSPIEFCVPGNGYKDLASTTMTIEAKIVKKDGTDLKWDESENGSKSDQVGPANYWSASLFNQVDVWLNDSLITHSTQTYAYVAYLKALMHYSKETKETLLTPAMYYKDTAGAMEQNKPFIKEDDAEEEENEGLRTRALKTAGSKTVRMTFRPSVDLFEQPKCLVSGVEMKIKFTRSPHQFNLIGERDDYKVVIQNATLNVRHVYPTQSMFKMHEKSFQSGMQATYDVRRFVSKTFTVSKGDQSFNKDNIFQGQVPDSLTMAFVRDRSYQGDITTNPFNLVHKYVKFINVTVNGNSEPVAPLHVDFENELYSDAYYNLHQYTGRCFIDKGNDITPEEYSDGYTIFQYDLSPDQTAFDFVKSLRPDDSQLRIEIQFRDGLDETLKIVLIGTFMNAVYVDGQRRITTDYKTS